MELEARLKRAETEQPTMDAMLKSGLATMTANQPLWKYLTWRSEGTRAHSGPGKGAVEPAECLRGRAHAETHGDKRRSRSTLPCPRKDDGGGKQRSHSIHACIKALADNAATRLIGARIRPERSHRPLPQDLQTAMTQRPVKSPAAPRQLVLGRGKLCIEELPPGINDSDLRHFARASRRPIPGLGGVSRDQPLRHSHPNPSSIKEWLTRGKGLSSTDIANSAGMECDGENSRHPAHNLAEVQPVGKLNATILTNRTNFCYANSVTLWPHESWTGPLARLWRPAQAASTLHNARAPVQLTRRQQWKECLSTA